MTVRRVLIKTEVVAAIIPPGDIHKVGRRILAMRSRSRPHSEGIPVLKARVVAGGANKELIAAPHGHGLQKRVTDLKPAGRQWP